MRKLLLAAAVMAALAGRADAHAFLQSAVPPVGGSAASVNQLRLAFTEELEPAFSTVTVRRADGAPVAAKTAPDPRDAKALLVRFAQQLPPGGYKVTWRVVSVDTHHTQGSYEFTVAP